MNTSIIPYIFFAVFILFAVLVIIYLKKQKEKNAIKWRDLAQRLGLTYSEEMTYSTRQKYSEKQAEQMERLKSSALGQKLLQFAKMFAGGHLSGKYNSVKVKLLTETRGGGGNSSSTTYYIIEASFEGNLSLGLSIYKEGFFSKVGKVFGTQDIQVGWKELDDLVMIKGNDGREVKDFILNKPGLKDAIRDLYLSSSLFSITDNGIYHEDTNSFLLDIDRAVQILDEMTGLAKKFMR